jgi:hypothetical protein
MRHLPTRGLDTPLRGYSTSMFAGVHRGRTLLIE